MKFSRIFHPSRSIASRLTWRVTITVFLIMTATVLLIGFVIWVLGTTLVGLLYSGTVRISEERINGVFNSVEIAVRNQVPFANEMADNPNEVFMVTQRLLQLNHEIYGSAIAFEPNYYPQKGKFFAPYSYQDSTDIQTKQLGTREYDYIHKEWYAKAKTNRCGTWSQPYYDEGGGEMAMITYSLPLYNKQDKLYSVLTADLSMDFMETMRAKVDEYNNSKLNLSEDTIGHSFSMIIDSAGVIIAHPERHRVLKQNLKDYFMDVTDAREAEEIVPKLLKKRSYFTITEINQSLYMVYRADIKENGWAMLVFLPLSDLTMWTIALSIILGVLYLIGLILVALVCGLTIRRTTKPLRKFAGAVDEISRGNLEVELPKIKTKDEMLMLRNSFETMQNSLCRQIEETKHVNAEKGRMEGELLTARNIQMSMLPKMFPPYPERDDIDIYGQQTPAREVGGDLFDFYIRDEKLFFCIGDVSGKGVPASLFMAVTRSLFRSISAHESVPARIITIINEAITENNDSNMFVTLFVGVLDLPTGRLRYCNAGHNSPLLKNSEKVGVLPCNPNLPLGVQSDWHFSSQETTIYPQTIIFLYTDGLTEAENIHQELFNEERVIDVAEQSALDAQGLIDNMTTALHEFVGDAEQNDDQTMLSIQYTKEQDKNIVLQRSLTLPNDVDEIPQLAAFVDEVCEAVGFDMPTTMSMNLAMEEAVVNVMTYAYPQGTNGNINIEAKANDNRLKFVITDWGVAFDPTAKEDADTTLSAEERPIGGLGIFLVRQLMDSINYERIDGKNVLTLRKKLV